MERALAWEAALESNGQPIARVDVDSDFAAVTVAIQQLVADLR